MFKFFQKFSNVKKGLYLVLGTALISGLAVFLNKFATDAVGNASVFTTAKNFIVAMILSLIILTPHVVDEFKKITKKEWLMLGAIGIIGGSVAFLLFFEGLARTNASSAGFIHKTLFIWVAILAIPLLKEKLSKIQFIALGLLIVSNFFLSGTNFLNFNTGSLLIFSATVLWAIEYVIAKKLLSTIDPKIVAWARMFFGAIIMIAFLLFTNQFRHLFTLNGLQWSWIVLTSAILLGYVLTWYFSMKHLPVSVLSSILVIASPITTLLNNIFVTHQYSTNQALGSLIALFGVSLIAYTLYKNNKNESTIAKQPI